MATVEGGFIHRDGGIDWYIEQRGHGPDVVLIPSGEGDCAAFAQVAKTLKEAFRVTTFDTPGFSRTSAPADPRDISTVKLGAQIADLIRSLGIESATVYGCSSGGLATLDLVVHHRDLVRHAIVHEVALAATEAEELPPFLAAAVEMSDADVAATMSHVFATVLNEDPEKWHALGGDYHARMQRNYVTWVRRYIQGPAHAVMDPAALKGLPITWTIGGLSMVAPVFGNVVISHRAEIELGMLPCRHFPQVSIPEMLAAHIAACAVRAA